MVFNIYCICDDKSNYCTYLCKFIKICQSLTLFYIFVFISCINTVQQVSAETVNVTAQKKNCYEQLNGDTQCILKEATQLVFIPHKGQESVMMIKAPNGYLLGNLSIIVEKISLACQVKTDYFTRSFAMHIKSSKRCPMAGSCRGDICGTIEHNSTIDEFNGIANESPGFTYCTESCGCAGCGCFLCGSGCLFYRIYARPITEAVYEVFSCPTWKYKAKITIAINLKHENMQETLDVETGRQYSWKNITVSLTSSNPPAPILGSHFLTDGTKTVMVHASASGQKISGTVGQLQCSNKKNAFIFNCTLPHDSCICQTTQTRAKCQCYDQNLEPLFENTELQVPLKSEGVSIIGTGKNIEVEYNEITSLEMQVGIEGLQLITKVQKNLCVIKNLDFARHHSALTGAILRFICKTDFGQATAHVKCSVGSFITMCTNSGYTSNATLNFHNEFVPENCTVTCPAGSTSFTLFAKLGQKERNSLFNVNNVNSPPIEIGENSRNRWGKWLLYIAASLGGVVVIVVAVKYLLNNYAKLNS